MAAFLAHHLKYNGLPVNKFGASQTWLLSFLRRNSLSIRRRTHQSQNFTEDAVAQAENLVEEYGRKWWELV
ncbi:hypothetical protein PHPALM_29041 [Phytophthora palmivora]|uniref:HTH CENPB-type domain-containing protein n=1 Tax=Phytophthora palmivora TaxID=4796 RepID=A0A2P4X8L2_9STRA|nr:hypothetical protein PHPALM_29041 [Phytophthora palmivora]